MSAMYDGFWHYMRFYQTYALDTWTNLGPSGYGYLLLGIGLFGWLLMKSTSR